MDPGRPLDPSALSLLLEAASWAPSHGRTDPWSFVVFQSPQGARACWGGYGDQLKDRGPAGGPYIRRRMRGMDGWQVGA